MLELLGILLENGCKWANNRVLCNIEIDQKITITIDDDGPGCEKEHFEQLSQRGLPVDESVEGHGLGLSIAREIVDSYAGTIQFSSSPVLGGFRVSIAIPLP